MVGQSGDHHGCKSRGNYTPITHIECTSLVTHNIIITRRYSTSKGLSGQHISSMFSCCSSSSYEPAIKWPLSKECITICFSDECFGGTSRPVFAAQIHLNLWNIRAFLPCELFQEGFRKSCTESKTLERSAIFMKFEPCVRF